MYQNQAKTEARHQKVVQYHTPEQMMGHIVPPVGNTVCFQNQPGSGFLRCHLVCSNMLVLVLSTHARVKT